MRATQRHLPAHSKILWRRWVDAWPCILTTLNHVPATRPDLEILQARLGLRREVHRNVVDGLRLSLRGPIGNQIAFAKALEDFSQRNAFSIDLERFAACCLNQGQHVCRVWSIP